MKVKKEVKIPQGARSPDRTANERFVHLRNTNNAYPNGRMVNNVTAFIRNVDGVDYVAFAECDSRDQFNRKRGRVVARRKFFIGKRVPLLTMDGPDLYDRALDTYYEMAGAE